MRAWHYARCSIGSSKLDTALAAPSVGVRRGFTARCGPRGCWRGTSSRATMCSTPSVRNIWWRTSRRLDRARPLVACYRRDARRSNSITHLPFGWNIPTCSTHGPTWTLQGQACRGERTDDKPRGEWSSLRLSRGAKEEDDSQPTLERIQCQAVWLRRTRTRLDNV